MRLCHRKKCTNYDLDEDDNCNRFWDIDKCTKIYSQHKPMDEIRKSRAELEKKIRKACEDFVSETGAAITNVDIDLTETTSIGGGPMETVINYVKVEIGDR